MSPAAQRIALAALDGMDKVALRPRRLTGRYEDDLCECIDASKDEWGREVPEYLIDRDAIAALFMRVHHPRFDYREEGNVWSIFATLSHAEDAECLDKAIQRVALAAPALWAEAILRATGKWDDSL